MVNFFKLYFRKSAPLLIESILFFSLLMTWVMYPETPYQFSFLVAIIAFVFWVIKLLGIINKLKLMKEGAFTQATLLKIESTNVKVNRRRVKKYLYRFEIEGESHDVYYKSNKSKKLFVGDKNWVYYLPENTKKTFIPEFYNLKLKEQNI